MPAVTARGKATVAQVSTLAFPVAGEGGKVVLLANDEE